jgi:hypothetical protein
MFTKNPKKTLKSRWLYLLDNISGLDDELLENLLLRVEQAHDRATNAVYYQLRMVVFQGRNGAGEFPVIGVRTNQDTVAVFNHTDGTDAHGIFYSVPPADNVMEQLSSDDLSGKTFIIYFSIGRLLDD